MKTKDSKRLDSIKAAHQSERTRSSTRMEDYLEIIVYYPEAVEDSKVNELLNKYCFEE